MNNRLSPEIEKQLNALCREISVGEGIDEELREELRGHMEDKFLAYLDGEEEVGERDALILVREHFGDPKVVRSMLCDVHEYEADISLMRKLAALLVLFFAAHLISHFGVLYSRRFLRGLSMIALAWPLLCIYVMVIHACALRLWKTQMNSGKRLWFQTMAPLRLVALVLGAGLFYYLLFPMQFGSKPEPGWETKSWLFAIWYWQHIDATFLLHMFVLSFLWLWWVDLPSRNMTFVRLLGVTLVLFCVASSSGISWNFILYNNKLFIADNATIRIFAYLGCCALPAICTHMLSRHMRNILKLKAQGAMS